MAKKSGALSGEDIIHYYEYTAGRGDLNAMLLLGQVHYTGTSSAVRDINRSFKYFERTYKAAVKEINTGEASKDIKHTLGEAAAYLGVMHWRGDGTVQNTLLAKKFFEIGAKYKNVHAYTYLGMMHARGLHFDKSQTKAVEYYKLAGSDPYAQTNLADTLIDHDVAGALNLYNQAGRSSMYAMYRAGEIYIGQKQCSLGIDLLKLVSENGWDETAIRAQQAYAEGDYETALVMFGIAAEAGDLTSQLNFGYIVDELTSAKRGSVLAFHDLSLAATRYWTLAAGQGHGDAKIKLANRFYYGSSRAFIKPDLERAVAFYRDASETNYSPLAMYSLAYMYEYGLGVATDGFMSKRWYEQSLQAEPNGYLACYAGLVRVWLKFYPQLLASAAETRKAVAAKDASSEEDLFGDEEADFSKMLRILAGELWSDILLLVALGAVAVYLYRQRRVAVQV